MPPCFYWLDNGRRSHETPLRKNYGSVIALYKKSRESPAFLYFIRKTRLFALLSQIGRIAHHHIFVDANRHVVVDFDQHIYVLHLLDRTVDSAGGDDFLSFFECVTEFHQLFLPFLLRTYHEKIHHRKNQHHHNQQRRARSSGSRSLEHNCCQIHNNQY